VILSHTYKYYYALPRVVNFHTFFSRKFLLRYGKVSTKGKIFMAVPAGSFLCALTHESLCPDVYCFLRNVNIDAFIVCVSG